RNSAPFNILHELENNYMDINVSDVKFQGELKWKDLDSLELGGLGAIRYQGTAQHHHVRDESNQATQPRWMPTCTIRDSNPYLYKYPENPFAIPVTVLPEGGIYNRTDYNMVSTDFRFTAQYDKNFGYKHTLNLFGATTFNTVERSDNWFRGWGM